MGQLVVTAAGAAIGNAILPGIGGNFGAILGSALGAALFGENQASQGPRLDELRVTGTEYGQALPWGLGTVRTAGQLWWASDRRETATTQSVGKGGGASSTSYTYDVDLLIGINDGQIAGITRIWINGKLTWTNLASATDASRINSEQTDAWSSLTVYTGTSSQLPDPTYEAAVGVGNAPAYRGRAYIVIAGLQLGNSGQVPNITVEYGTALTDSPDIVRRLDARSSILFDSDTVSGVGRPVIVGMFPEVRIAVNASANTTVYRFDLAGNYLGVSSRTGAQEQIPYPALPKVAVGLLNGLAVYITNNVLSYSQPIGSRQTVQIGAGLLDLTTVLPTGRYLMSLALCTDGIHALAVTSTADTSGGAAAVSPQWHMVRYDGTLVLEASGTVDTSLGGVNNYQFGVGNFSSDSSGIAGGVGILESDLLHLWCVFPSGASQINTMWAIDPDGVLRRKSRVVTTSANTTRYTYQSIWAEDGFAVCIAERSFNAWRRQGTTIATVPVRTAVETICKRAGLTPAQIDASALASISRQVRGVAVGQIGNARGVLEQLATAYQFEAVVSDKLYFTPRGGAVEATIPYADLGAGEDQPQAEPLALQISSDLELPPQVAVSYRNAAADYQTATEMSDRLISGQAAISTVQLGMALLPSEAKIAADAIVADQLAGLVTSTIHLPLQYAKLQPTSVVQVTDATGALQRMRIVRRTDAGGVLTCEVVADDAQAVVSAGTTDATYTASSAVNAIATTLLYAWDMPLLRDTDDTPGYYVSARGNDTIWPGAIALTSNDNATFTQAASVAESAVMGTTTSVLGAWTGGAVFDEVNSVTVSVGAGTLSSVTRDALLQGRTTNAMIIGSEVIKFQAAALQSANPNIYKLSSLLRGQLGTEWAQAGHASGERVALITTQGWRRVSQTTDDRNRTKYLKGVTNGRSVADTLASTFVNSGISSAPLAPVDARISRAVNGDVTLSWKRRTRYVPTFGGASGISVPLDAPAELYDVVFYRNAGFADVDQVGSVLGITSAATVRSYYDMFVANGLAAPTAIYAKVYQRNGSLRGRALNVSATLPSVGGAGLNPMLVAVSASGVIVESGAGGGVPGSAYWLASAPDGTYTATTTPNNDNGRSPLWFSTGGRYAQNDTLAISFVPSSVLDLSGNRSQSVFSIARLDLSAQPYAPTTSPYFATPRAIVGDGSRFVLFGEGNKVYSSTDGVAWSLLGTMSGASFPTLIGSDDATSQRVIKIGSRWFLIFSQTAASGTATTLFYSDHADAVTGWTACTGIDVSTATLVMAGIVSDGTYLYAVRTGIAGGAEVFRSADNGASWTSEFASGATAAAFALHCTGTVSGTDKVRLYCGGTTYEKLVGSVSWTSKASGLVNPYSYRITPAGRMVVIDNPPTFSGGSARVAYETDGVFATVGPF